MAHVHSFKEKLPERLPVSSYDIEEIFFTKNFHPLKGKILLIRNKTYKIHVKSIRLRLPYALSSIRCILLIDSNRNRCCTRFTRSSHLEMVLLTNKPSRYFEKTPWHILIFAFSMYVIIYGLHNAGLTDALVNWLEPVVSQHLLYASFAMGGLVSLLSNVFNNHPALMIGTITLTEMGLDPVTLKRSTSQTLLVVTSVHYYYQSVR